MNQLQNIAILLITGLLFWACSKDNSNPTIIDVKYDEWSQTGDIRLQLSGEIEDSRCPVADQIDCIWEGRADGIVLAEVATETYALPYSIMGLCDIDTDTCGSLLDTLGYQFQFLSLTPYPDGQPVQTEYVLSVRVSKN